jgi:fermentation-respiration switch protein FrsA (DUF1100 family)
MRRLRSFAWALGILLILVLVGVGVVSYKAGQSLIHPPRDLSARTPSTVNLTWSWANFTTQDGLAIVGWWIPADSTPADNGTVVFLHGYGDSKAQGLEIDPMLHGLGVNVLSFDFRAHGQSAGTYTTAGVLETRDVDGALAWLSSKLGQSRPRVVLLGWSAGGAVALNAAAHVAVDGIIVDSSFSSLQRIVETSISNFTHLPKWPFGPLAVQFASWSVGIPLDRNQPAAAVRGYDGPLLMFQGLADDAVTPDQVDAISANAPQAQVVKVPGAHHLASYKTDPSSYRAHVQAFLTAAWQA